MTCGIISTNMGSNKKMRFLVDFMLGRLQKWLSLMGIDAEYFTGNKSSDLIYRSLKERRIILTRNTHLSSKKPYGLYLLKNDDFRDQIREISDKFGIDEKKAGLFKRCNRCNRELKTIEKKEVKKSVPEYVYKNHDEYAICEKCSKIFWKGIHKELIESLIDRL